MPSYSSLKTLSWHPHPTLTDPLQTLNPPHLTIIYYTQKKGTGLQMPLGLPGEGMEEGSVLFNDALNTFSYGYIVSDIW